MSKFVIPHAADKWSERAGKCQFRRYPHKGVDSLWKREHDAMFYGGIRITLCPIGTRRAEDWLAEAARLSGMPVEMETPPVSHP
jgi:hypothetical protein